MSQRAPRYSLYREFIDAFMKGHPEMTRCTSHHSAQAEWSQIKKNETLVKEKISEYLESWNKAGQPEIPSPSRKTASQNNSKSKTTGGKRKNRKRNHSSDEDDDVDDPSFDPDAIEPVTPTFTRREPSPEVEEMDTETLAKKKPWVARSVAKAAKKKAQAEAAKAEEKEEKVRTPVQQMVMKDLQEISERIANLLQVKSMGLLTPENQKTLKKLIEQKKQRTTELKRLQSKQRASTRYRERKKRRVEQLCAANPDVAAELSRAFRSNTHRTQIEDDCPDLLQIISEIARVGGATDSTQRGGKPYLSLDDLKDTIKQRGYEIRKSSLYYRLLPQRAISHDGKKHSVTVPVRVRKCVNPDSMPKHEDCHFTAASLRHLKDLAGIFGNDCVFYVTQNTNTKIKIGRPTVKGHSPLIMHLDYNTNVTDYPIASRHQFTPTVYAASVIDENGLITNVGPTYISVRSAKHDRCTHETQAVDFDRLLELKEFDKVARDYMGRVKPIMVINLDSTGPENHPLYPKTLATAIDKFRKHNLDVLLMIRAAPAQNLFNIVERRLAPLSHDLAGLILPHDHFGTHLNEAGATEHAELEKENFKKTADVLAEVWSMNVLDEYPVVAEYISPSPAIDDQLQMADSTLALNSVLDQICVEDEEEIPLEQRLNQTRPEPMISATASAVKTEYDIDEYWCANHVLQTQYTIQIIRCSNPACCTPWRSNYIQVFPHRFLPPPVPFNRSKRGVRMAEIESSSAANNPVSPFYGNLFQRIQFHGIVLNRTQNELLPFDACCPSLQNVMPSRVCSICKQYIPSAMRLRQHYKIHRQNSNSGFIDYNNNDNKEEVIDDTDVKDPYEISLVSTNPIQNGVCLFPDMVEWLRSEFEDDPVVDTKVKSTAATASAMIRKDKQAAAAAAAATSAPETCNPTDENVNPNNNSNSTSTIDSNAVQPILVG